MPTSPPSLSSLQPSINNKTIASLSLLVEFVKASMRRFIDRKPKATEVFMITFALNIQSTVPSAGRVRALRGKKKKLETSLHGY